MSSFSNRGKKAVEMAPGSRIRRDPVPVGKTDAPIVGSYWHSSEKEAWIVAVGVVLFAIAITIITFGISDFTAS